MCSVRLFLYYIIVWFLFLFVRECKECALAVPRTIIISLLKHMSDARAYIIRTSQMKHTNRVILIKNELKIGLDNIIKQTCDTHQT